MKREFNLPRAVPVALSALSLVREWRFIYPLLIAVLVSLVPPAVFLIASGGGTAETRTPSGYTTLIFDEGKDEREIAALLTEHNIKSFAGESTARVFLNDFDGVQEMTLPEWRERLEPFDPRNDGYADKARSIFIGGGKRRIFIPSGELNGFLSSAPDQKVIDALESFGASVQLETLKQDKTPNRIIFILAALTLVFIARKIFLIKREAFIFHPPQAVSALPLVREGRLVLTGFHYVIGFIPSLAILADSGAAGFALAALSLALFQLVRKPALSFLTSLRYEKSRLASELLLISPVQRGRGILEMLFDEISVELPKIAVIAALWIVTCAAGKIPFAAAFCFFLIFSLSFLSMLNLEARCGKIAAHIPFKFMPILPGKRAKTAFPLLPVPLIAAALLQIALTSLSGAPASADPATALINLPPAWEKAPSVSERDYEAHFEFQKNFVFKNLNTAKTDDYLRYSLGDDGLIASSGALQAGNQTSAPPPWDLAPLVDFLQNGGGGASSRQPVNTGSGILAVLLALCLYIPFMRHRRFLPCLRYEKGAC
jgi:hypothetical protein